MTQSEFISTLKIMGFRNNFDSLRLNDIDVQMQFDYIYILSNGLTSAFPLKETDKAIKFIIKELERDKLKSK